MANRKPLVFVGGEIAQLPDGDTSTPTGTAGGVLSGEFPNPGFAQPMATQSSLAAHTGNSANPHNTTKAQVGLGNVDNTTDAAKPVSTATQTALNLKANLAGPSFTGNVVLGSTSADTVTVNGYMGVGVVPSGAAKLEIAGALIASGYVHFGDNGTNGRISLETGTSVTQLLSTTAGFGAYQHFETKAASHKWFLSTSTVGATLDTSGNLGLGVTPSAINATFKAFEIGSTTLMSGAGLATYIDSNAYYSTAGNYKYKADGFALEYAMVMSDGSHRWYTAPSGTAGDAISFGDPKMTLDAVGNLVVGQVTYGLQNANGISLSVAAQQLNVNHSGTATGTYYAGFGYNGSTIGSITQSGTTAVVYNTTSDHRLKTNVRDANAARFMDIQFRDFEWTDGRHDCGVIAHELQAIYPDLVTGEKDAVEVRTVEITPAVPEVKDEDGNVITPAVPAVTEEQTFPVYQQVNYTGLIARMGTVIQQQHRALEAMTARVDELEKLVARIEALENKLNG